MPQFNCFCGVGISLTQSQVKQVVMDAEKFCSVSCFRSYLQSLPLRASGAANRQFLQGKPAYVSEPNECWDEVTQRHYRSWYEVYVARFFVEEDIQAIYEKITLQLGRKQYTPDFFLPQWDVFVEVKGPWTISAKTKFVAANQIGETVLLLPAYLQAAFAKRYRRRNEVLGR